MFLGTDDSSRITTVLDIDELAVTVVYIGPIVLSTTCMCYVDLYVTGTEYSSSVACMNVIVGPNRMNLVFMISFRTFWLG